MSKFSSTLQKQLAMAAEDVQLVSSSFSVRGRTASAIIYRPEGAQLLKDLKLQSLDISIDSSGSLCVHLVLDHFPQDGQILKLTIREKMLESFDGKSLRNLGMEFIKKEILARRREKKPRSRKRKDS